MTTSVLEKLCCQIPWCQPAILESTLELALEIAREGREGRRIGTLFTLGKADAVLAASRPLILDPLVGHAPAQTHITDPDLRGTIKELAQLDGAFVISEAGTIVAACRYLDASVEQIELPLGLWKPTLGGCFSVSEAWRDRDCRVREWRGPGVLRRPARSRSHPRAVAARPTPRSTRQARRRRTTSQCGCADG